MPIIKVDTRSAKKSSLSVRRASLKFDKQPQRTNTLIHTQTYLQWTRQKKIFFFPVYFSEKTSNQDLRSHVSNRAFHWWWWWWWSQLSKGCFRHRRWIPRIVRRLCSMIYTVGLVVVANRLIFPGKWSREQAWRLFREMEKKMCLLGNKNPFILNRWV